MDISRARESWDLDCCYGLMYGSSVVDNEGNEFPCHESGQPYENWCLHCLGGELIGHAYEEIDRMRESGKRLEGSIMRMDEAAMPPEEREEDTRRVGGPVSQYCVDYDEDQAVERVTNRLKSLEAEVEDLRSRLESSRSGVT